MNLSPILGPQEEVLVFFFAVEGGGVATAVPVRKAAWVLRLAVVGLDEDTLIAPVEKSESTWITSPGSSWHGETNWALDKITSLSVSMPTAAAAQCSIAAPGSRGVPVVFL